MPIPDYQTLMRPVLKAFAEGQTRVKDVLPLLASEFSLTAEELEARLPSGGMTVLSNRANWARTYLGKAGLLRSPKRGFHEITDAGRAALDRFPDRIDRKTLQTFDAFNTWQDEIVAKPGTTTPNGVPSLSGPEQDTTPDVRLSEAFTEIEAALIAEVIEAVLSLTPGQFEKLVVDLLLAMGYGRGDLARGLQTSLSGDGGIDGIVNEDELGLDAVYIQAKRYAPENPVGRPALNAFVGSLTGEGAGKGVFVTTSTFTSGARDYVDRVAQRIVLIDGARLARLMINHEVGVRARQTYVIRSIDEDYFANV